MHSSHIHRISGLTSPQLILLKAIRDNHGAMIGHLSEQINLSQATTTTILNRLANQGLLVRYRSQTDRRKVHVRLTETGKKVLEEAPLPLRRDFIERFESLKVHERTAMLSCLQHICEMMNCPASKEGRKLELNELDKAM